MKERTITTLFYTAAEVMEMLGVSRCYAYRIIKQMNEELNSKGFLTVSGKVPKKYFDERYYGLAQ